MWLRKYSITFVLGFLVLAGTGCLGPPWSIVTYEAVAPVLPKGTSGEIDKSIIKLYLGTVTLAAQVQAFDLDGRSIPPPLGVWLNIEPQQGALVLKTSQVKLSVEGGGEISPVYYLGPETKRIDRWTLAAGCGPSVYRRGLNGVTINLPPHPENSTMDTKKNVHIHLPSDEQIKVKKESCFIFWFDTASLPDYSFALNIEGLMFESNSNEVLIPEIIFEPVRIEELRF